MNRDMSNINKQVILVVDKDRKRRIEKGYYSDIDQSKIAVVSSVDNIIVDEKPDTSDLGKCTYIRSDFDPGMYYRIDNYQYKCAEKRQSALVNILKRLQISDYYVVSRFRFKAKAEIGNKTNMKIEGGVKATSFYGAGLNGNYNPDQQGAVSANVGFHLDIVDEWHFDQKCEEPTDFEWQEAKKIAIVSGLYNNDVIKALVDAREPNKGSILKSTHKEVRLGTNISLDIDIFKSITGLLCFNYKLLEANGSGSNTKTFNFHAEVNGEYVTDIIYNFDPKETDRFKELVESYKNK